jgi:hypothetical protein
MLNSKIRKMKVLKLFITFVIFVFATKVSAQTTTSSAQFNYNFSKLEVYGGAENTFNFRQNQPIISWQDPFSPYFDTSSVWGPTRGRELYVGLRYKLPKI